MMNRIDRCFNDLKRANKKAVIFFVTAGDPSLKVTRQFMRYAQEIGVDAVELGVPFSDPVADGPVIQAAGHRALRKSVTLKKILHLIKTERKKGWILPVILMSAYNPIYAYGIERFSRDAQNAGVDGIIIPDLATHESKSMRVLTRRIDLKLILMQTPASGPERKRMIHRLSGGFIYYMSVTGVTGERVFVPNNIRKEVLSARKISGLPVCIGFGISRPKQAAKLKQFSDGVIIGSALVRHLHDHSKQSLSRKSKAFIRGFITKGANR